MRTYPGRRLAKGVGFLFARQLFKKFLQIAAQASAIDKPSRSIGVLVFIVGLPVRKRSMRPEAYPDERCLARVSGHEPIAFLRPESLALS